MIDSIQAPEGDRAVFYFNRGNGGTLSDIVALAKTMLTIPVVTGGSGEQSYTF